MLLTIGVWLLLIAFVTVHWDKIITKLRAFNGYLLLRRISSWATATVTVLCFLLIPYFFYRGSTHYEGVFKLPFLAGAILSGCFLLMLFKELPSEYRRLYREPMSFGLSSSSRNWGAFTAEMLGVLVAQIGVLGPVYVLYKGFRWSYEHRNTFRADGGLLVIVATIGVAMAVVFLCAPILAAAQEIRESLEEKRPVVWEAVAIKAAMSLSVLFKR